MAQSTEYEMKYKGATKNIIVAYSTMSRVVVIYMTSYESADAVQVLLEYFVTKQRTVIIV